MTRRAFAQGYSLRDLQSLLGIPRRILQGLVDAGFVKPTRGRRNEMRFDFRDVVLLRTAFQLRSAKIPARRIVQALERLRLDLPEELPLSGIRITAVGDAVAVKTGSDQWDANSGQFLMDFEVAELKGDVTFLDSSPSSKVSLTKQADDWYALAEKLQDSDPVGAEQAYRKALKVSPDAHYHAYNNLGALLSRDETRCSDALDVFEDALKHFNEAELLHYNRAVLLEQMDRLDEAAASYLRCAELNPQNDDAIFSRGVILEQLGRLDEAAQAYASCLELNPKYEDALRHLTRLNELKGDGQAVIRHLSAWRRSNA